MRNQKTLELVLTAIFSAIIVLMAFTPLGYIPLVVINATIIHVPVIIGSLFCGPKKGAFMGFVFGLTSFIKNTIMPSSLSAFVFSPVLASSMIGVSGIFKSAAICFIPRILVGVVPYFVFLGVRKLLGNSKENKSGALILNIVISVLLGFGLEKFMLKSAGENASATVFIVIAVVVAAALFFVLNKVVGSSKPALIAFIYAGISGAFVNTLLVMSGIYIFYKDAYANALSVNPAEVIGIIGGVISFNGVIEAIVAAVIVAGVGVVLQKVKPIDFPKVKTQK
ncbi:MAG: ECF transporter S component [Clostridia bacterium]|nr:ECF transporter S component [Clostridia bacterium]